MDFHKRFELGKSANQQADSSAVHSNTFAFHKQQVLEYEFEFEKQAAGRAASRVRERRINEAKKMEKERERERMSRWYNDPQLNSKSSHKISGAKRARLRVKKARSKIRKEEARRADESTRRWYEQTKGRQPAANAFVVAKHNAKTILKAKHEEEKQRLEAEKERRKQIDANISRVLAAGREALSGRVNQGAERVDGVFYPGPYNNVIECTYGDGRVAVCRRVFDKI
mmetsp:Transcript_26317/g.42627  ORF Transcript_26317/g.42627 Transcript_26317/m.42627 type:complete len:227 (-) Transcript_26317:216-896(-)